MFCNNVARFDISKNVIEIRINIKLLIGSFGSFDQICSLRTSWSTPVPDSKRGGRSHFDGFQHPGDFSVLLAGQIKLQDFFEKAGKTGDVKSQMLYSLFRSGSQSTQVE